MDKEIDPIEFIEARSKEINLLEENISKKRKKTMLFQRLPFFLRRRTQSYKPKKRKTRKKSFLTTYIGKRFFVTDTLPIKRRLKSSKFVYKSKKVFLFYEFKVKDYFIFECFNKERSIFDEIIWFSDIKNGSDLCIDEQILESKEILTVDQIFKDKQILLDDWLKEKTNNFTLTPFYFKNKFVCHKSQLNKILFKKEFCLISINEMFRIILEKKIFLKYLNVFDKNYHNFEKLAKKEEIMKNKRRPLSKKQRLEYFEMMDYKYCCFFEVKKGSVVMNDKVFSEDEVLGNVLFVEYCYSVGRKRGVCWLTKLCSNLVVKNLAGKLVEIEIVESIKKDEFFN